MAMPDLRAGLEASVDEANALFRAVLRERM